jgi:hypothetical protein
VSARRLLPFAATLIAYTALLLLSRSLLASGSFRAPLDVAIALLPVPAGVSLLVIAVRELLSQDELEQRISLMALAVSFGATLLVAVSWGFLEGVGLERLSGFAWFAMLVAFYGVGLIWARARYR